MTPLAKQFAEGELKHDVAYVDAHGVNRGGCRFVSPIADCILTQIHPIVAAFKTQQLELPETSFGYTVRTWLMLI